MSDVDFVLKVSHEQADAFLLAALKSCRAEAVKALAHTRDTNGEIEDLLMFARVMEACEDLIAYHSVPDLEEKAPTSEQTPVPKFKLDDVIKYRGQDYIVTSVLHDINKNTFLYDLKSDFGIVMYKRESDLMNHVINTSGQSY